MAPPRRRGYRAGMLDSTTTIGTHLRAWRQRRRLSQLELALDTEISPRHLSFVETGRSTPSREMVLRLAEQLDIPMRERNVLLVAAGYAPVFSERSLSDPALAPARAAIEAVLAGHEPCPALAVDRHWTLVTANAAVMRLVATVDPALLVAPVNVLRLALHPLGLAPRTANLAEWRAHVLSRLHRQVELTADASLAALLEELRAYGGRDRKITGVPHEAVVPFQLMTDSGLLSFISTTMVFGTPVDVTLAELAVEAFYPADAATAEALRSMAR